MTIRNFTWADLPALAETINLVREAIGDKNIVSVKSLKEYLAQPGLAPEENCFLIDDKDFPAYSILHPELRIGRVVLEMGVHPARTGKGTERELVRSALARSRSLKAEVLHVCVSPTNYWKGMLEREGFSTVRDYLLMQWQEEHVPQVDVPEGFNIERFRPGDEARLTQVQNASFEGCWGFCPNTEEEVSYKSGMSICDTEGIFFLVQGDDTAGYCWTCTVGEPRYRIGVIDMIGVIPGYRGRGLSEPVLLTGMKHLRSRGVRHIRLDVDSENIAGTKLYASAGFKAVQKLQWFEARLSEG